MNRPLASIVAALVSALLFTGCAGPPLEQGIQIKRGSPIRVIAVDGAEWSAKVDARQIQVFDLEAAQAPYSLVPPSSKTLEVSSGGGTASQALTLSSEEANTFLVVEAPDSPRLTCVTSKPVKTKNVSQVQVLNFSDKPFVIDHEGESTTVAPMSSGPTLELTEGTFELKGQAAGKELVGSISEVGRRKTYTALIYSDPEPKLVIIDDLPVAKTQGASQ